MKRIIVTAATALMLGACAGMDQAECTSADWHMIGFEDGSAGRAPSNIGNYRKACAEHGVAPSLAQYQQGHAEGVRYYCTRSNGFDQGQRGVSYRGICPADLEGDYLDAYALGRDYYVLSSAVSSLDSKITSSRNRIKSLEKSIANKTLRVASDETPSAERITLLLDIKNHHAEIGELKARIDDYEYEKEAKEAEYAQLERPDLY